MHSQSPQRDKSISPDQREKPMSPDQREKSTSPDQKKARERAAIVAKLLNLRHKHTAAHSLDPERASTTGPQTIKLPNKSHDSSAGHSHKDAKVHQASESVQPPQPLTSNAPPPPPAFGQWKNQPPLPLTLNGPRPPPVFGGSFAPPPPWIPNAQPPLPGFGDSIVPLSWADDVPSPPHTPIKLERRINARGRSPRVSVIRRPMPSPAYLQQASSSYTIGEPRPLLVILDLNGVLVARKKKKGFIPRPSLAPFLDYLFGNHHVMVWSSGKPDNVASICKRVFSEAHHDALVAIWARDRLRLSPKHYPMNVQVYKQLLWAWEDGELARAARSGTQLCARAMGEYGQANTVLVDDTAEKAVAEPFNLLRVSEFFGAEAAEEEEGLLMEVVEYLEAARRASDVSAYMRAVPFKVSNGEIKV